MFNMREKDVQTLHYYFPDDIDMLHFSFKFWTKFDMKMAKMEQNHMANLNMNVLGIVWQIVVLNLYQQAGVNISTSHVLPSNINKLFPV